MAEPPFAAQRPAAPSAPAPDAWTVEFLSRLGLDITRSAPALLAGRGSRRRDADR